MGVQDGSGPAQLKTHFRVPPSHEKASRQLSEPPRTTARAERVRAAERLRVLRLIGVVSTGLPAALPRRKPSHSERPGVTHAHRRVGACWRKGFWGAAEVSRPTSCLTPLGGNGPPQRKEQWGRHWAPCFVGTSAMAVPGVLQLDRIRVMVCPGSSGHTVHPSAPKHPPPHLAHPFRSQLGPLSGYTTEELALFWGFTGLYVFPRGLSYWTLRLYNLATLSASQACLAGSSAHVPCGCLRASARVCRAGRRRLKHPDCRPERSDPLKLHLVGQGQQHRLQAHPVPGPAQLPQRCCGMAGRRGLWRDSTVRSHCG